MYDTHRNLEFFVYSIPMKDILSITFNCENSVLPIAVESQENNRTYDVRPRRRRHFTTQDSVAGTTETRVPVGSWSCFDEAGGTRNMHANVEAILSEANSDEATALSMPRL